jgi:hypothetical protein
MARATLPTFPELCGSTRTMEIFELAGGFEAFFFGLLLRPMMIPFEEIIAAPDRDGPKRVYQNKRIL